MALKDWKIKNVREDRIDFYKNNKREITISGAAYGYDIVILKDGVKNFKTKSQALKFVRRYIKEN